MNHCDNNTIWCVVKAMSKQCTYGLKACTLNVHWYIYNIHIHTLYYIILLLYCVYIRNVYVSHNSLCRKYKGRQMHGWRWMKMMRMDSLKVSNDCMGPALKCHVWKESPTTTRPKPPSRKGQPWKHKTTLIESCRSCLPGLKHTLENLVDTL